MHEQKVVSGIFRYFYGKYFCFRPKKFCKKIFSTDVIIILTHKICTTHMVHFIVRVKTQKIIRKKYNFSAKKVMVKTTVQYPHFFSLSQKNTENLTTSANLSYNELSRKARKFGKCRDEERKTEWKNILYYRPLSVPSLRCCLRSSPASGF